MTKNNTASISGLSPEIRALRRRNRNITQFFYALSALRVKRERMRQKEEDDRRQRERIAELCRIKAEENNAASMERARIAKQLALAPEDKFVMSSTFRDSNDGDYLYAVQATVSRPIETEMSQTAKVMKGVVVGIAPSVKQGETDVALICLMIEEEIVPTLCPANVIPQKIIDRYRKCKHPGNTCGQIKLGWKVLRDKKDAFYISDKGLGTFVCDADMYYSLLEGRILWATGSHSGYYNHFALKHKYCTGQILPPSRIRTLKIEEGKLCLKEVRRSDQTTNKEVLRVAIHSKLNYYICCKTKKQALEILFNTPFAAISLREKCLQVSLGGEFKTLNDGRILPCREQMKSLYRGGNCMTMCACDITGYDQVPSEFKGGIWKRRRRHYNDTNRKK